MHTTPPAPITTREAVRDVRVPPLCHSLVLAEDHPIYREGLARAISANPRLRLVGEATDGHQVVELAEWLRPSLALLDVRMPGLDGLEACAQIVSLGSTRVVLLSAFAIPSLADAAAQAGASGFLSKESSRRDVLRSLVAVGDGRTVFATGGGPVPC
jgi:two-component system nitrate/nitrite response regulator NarL